MKGLPVINDERSTGHQRCKVYRSSTMQGLPVITTQGLPVITTQGLPVTNDERSRSPTMKGLPVISDARSTGHHQRCKVCRSSTMKGLPVIITRFFQVLSVEFLHEDSILAGNQMTAWEQNEND